MNPRPSGNLQNPRKYGNPPFKIAIIHGGPGAAGEMAPVAEELSAEYGVLEPFQTKNSLDGQVEELKGILEKQASLPVTLIGHSWGAWLSLVVAAQFPLLVKKLILVSSAGFQTDSGLRTQERRFQRMTKQDKQTLLALTQDFRTPDQTDKNEVFKRLGNLFSKIDAYDLVDTQDDPIIYQYDIYQAIWPEAEELRKSGKLLEYAAKITCPVWAIHGDHDPHRAADVQGPLSAQLKDFHFILLKKCGHRPWQEKHELAVFFERLRSELLN